MNINICYKLGQICKSKKIYGTYTIVEIAVDIATTIVEDVEHFTSIIKTSLTFGNNILHFLTF